MTNIENNYELIDRQNLLAEDEAIWYDMCTKTKRFWSPILLPDFSKIVHSVRNDVKVIVVRQGGKPIAFMPIHLRPGKFARPAGAPFSDYTALITYPNPQLNMAEILENLGIDKLQIIGLVDPYKVFGEFKGQDEVAYGIDVLSEIHPNSSSKKHQKNIRRLKRHLADTYGEVRFIYDDRNENHFKRMLEIKSEQTRETGVHDFLSPIWVQKLMEKLFYDRSGDYSGCLITLVSGDIPICFHFGSMTKNIMHPWIAAYDNDYFQYSPGQIFLGDVMHIFEENGIDYYDLSTGHSHYKATFTNDAHDVFHGRIHRTGLVEMNDKVLWNEDSKIGRIHNKLHRRLEQISSLELDIAGRAKGLAYALTSANKRMKK